MTPWDQRVASWLPRLVLAASVWCVLALLTTPLWPDATRGVSACFGLFNIPVAGNLFTAALLLLLGSALAVRKRAALLFVIVVFQLGWIVVASLVTILTAWDVAIVPDVAVDTTVEQVALVVEVVMAVLLVVVLWRIRDQYPARLAPGSWRRAVGALLAGLAMAAGIGIALTALFPNTLQSPRHRIMWPIRTAIGLSPDPDSVGYGGTGQPWVGGVIASLSTVALLWALAVLLRSRRTRRRLDEADELTIRRLLHDHGEADSLGYFATRRDKVAVFAPGRAAAVTYRVEGGTSLASGDPLGDPGAWPAAIEVWMAEARRFGWAVAVLSAGERGAEAYRRAGLRVIGIGDEAIVDVADFRLTGTEMAPVRQAVSRVRRAGYALHVRRHAAIPAAEMAALAELAERWRDDEPERGFSMALGRLGDPVDGRCVMATAVDPDGAVRALLSFVPWGRHGLSLDLMRRDPDADNGVVEFMVAGLVGAARGLGVRRISLNFAMFRGVFSGRERIGAGPVLRATAAVLTFASRWWQLETLYRSNVKYRPRWEPRFMCFGPTFGLHRGILAAGVAEGFLPGSRPAVHRGTSSDAFAHAVRLLDAEPVAVPLVRASGRQGLERRATLARLRAAGMEPYPVAVERTASVADVRAAHAGLPPGSSSGAHVAIAGRVVARRDHGGLVFAVLRDGGADLQVMLAADVLDGSAFALWRATVDRGDQVAIAGEVVTSRTGELSVLATRWTMAAKCLRPVPVLRPGAPVPDLERNLQLVVDPGATDALRARGRAVAALRAALVGRGFVEVETPMLQTVHGGANARPFVTHINAYDMDLSLRIAPELFLKRLAVGGIGRLFELNRNFRNEGADQTHNPEFTSLEVYEAHGDHESMRALARELILAAACAVHGAPVAHRPDGGFVDLGGEWPMVTVHAAVAAATGVPVDPGTPAAVLRELCAAHGVVAPFDASAGALVQRLHDVLVEPATTMPTFFTDFPLDVSPLARAHRDDPRLAERWDLVAFGMELGTAYSELTDPVDQRSRLMRQSMEAAAGDPEAMEVDEDFLGALELGLPPTGGLGLGVDRLLMLLTGTSIRGTLAFPFTRPDQPHQR